MAKKTKSVEGNGKDVLKVDPADYPDNNLERAKAEVGQSAIHGNALTSRKYASWQFGEMGLMESIGAMESKVRKVKAGDMSGMEALLVAQATALDAIFTELARRAAVNMGEYINATDTYMRLALKAQSQCRTTIEALGELKNPRPVAYVKQANIAHGPQQVNNARSPDEPPSRENSSNQSNELSGEGHELLPDSGASSLTGRVDSKMETLVALNGPTNH